MNETEPLPTCVFSKKGNMFISYFSFCYLASKNL